MSGVVNNRQLYAAQVVLLKHLILILVFSSSAMADGISFKENKNSLEKHQKKCLNQPPPAHKAIFKQPELCKFGKEGCTQDSIQGSFEVLCGLEMVSECYAQNAWQTRNQYFNLPPTVKVANISHTMTITNGKMTETICAHYK